MQRALDDVPVELAARQRRVAVPADVADRVEPPVDMREHDAAPSTATHFIAPAGISATLATATKPSGAAVTRRQPGFCSEIALARSLYSSHSVPQISSIARSCARAAHVALDDIGFAEIFADLGVSRIERHRFQVIADALVDPAELAGRIAAVIERLRRVRGSASGRAPAAPRHSARPWPAHRRNRPAPCRAGRPIAAWTHCCVAAVLDLAARAGRRWSRRPPPPSASAGPPRASTKPAHDPAAKRTQSHLMAFLHSRPSAPG